jgi:WXG100 family type VII secretion target
MSKLQVSSSAVEAAATTTAARVADFDARVSALDSLVSATIGADWIGAGAEAFLTDYAKWFAGAREVHEALARIASLLASTSQTYETTEGAVTHASNSTSIVTDTHGAGN